MSNEYTTRRSLNGGIIKERVPTPDVREETDKERRFRLECLLGDKISRRNDYMCRVVPPDMTICELAQAICEFRGGDDPASQLSLANAEYAKEHGYDKPIIKPELLAD